MLVTKSDLVSIQPKISNYWMICLGDSLESTSINYLIASIEEGFFCFCL